jgi:hypothetical protein
LITIELGPRHPSFAVQSIDPNVLNANMNMLEAAAAEAQHRDLIAPWQEGYLLVIPAHRPKEDHFFPFYGESVTGRKISSA